MADHGFVPSAPPPSSRPRRPGRGYPMNSDIIQANAEQVERNMPVRFRRYQEWLRRRYRNLHPGLFHDGLVLFYTAQQGLQPPEGFENVWGVISERHRYGGLVSNDEHQLLSQAHVVILLVDVQEREQMSLAFHMAEFINQNFGEDSALLMLAQHSFCPELRRSADEQQTFASLVDAFDKGIDEVIVGEPEGMRLIVEVQNRIIVHTALTRRISDRLLEEDRKCERARDLDEAMEDASWDYLRARLCTGIPVRDTSIELGIPGKIGEFNVGQLIGMGASGRVHRLNIDGEDSGFVLKAMRKARVASVDTMYEIGEHVAVMRRLSQEFPHPHITKLHQIYHSETHLHMVIEDGGPCNLFKHLRKCEQQNIHMPVSKTQAVISQIVQAVCHMHVHAKVAHCDLKPENILIAETGTDVFIKITDFDTAVVNPEAPKRREVGTFPFAAPEIVLNDCYDAYAADIWSMGVVFLEVLCRVEVLERALRAAGVHVDRNNDQLRARLNKEIVRLLTASNAVDDLLQEYLRPELRRGMNHELLEALPTMLDVSVIGRVRAQSLLSATWLQ
mmetsp:Transcript_93341/g.145598  ORF Transcript_93341/g.145598 Transcript_93341/m.145598 type:complete len:561 (-) Transcript_93341:61-1743(-)